MYIIPFFLAYPYNIFITLKSKSVPITATSHSPLPPDSCKNLFSIYMNWPFWIVHRNCHTLCVWLILFCIMPPRFMHVATNGRVSFSFKAERHSIVYTTTFSLSIHLSMDIGHFLVLASM